MAPDFYFHLVSVYRPPSHAALFFPCACLPNLLPAFVQASPNFIIVFFITAKKHVASRNLHWSFPNNWGGNGLISSEFLFWLQFGWVFSQEWIFLRHQSFDSGIVVDVYRSKLDFEMKLFKFPKYSVTLQKVRDILSWKYCKERWKLMIAFPPSLLVPKHCK